MIAAALDLGPADNASFDCVLHLRLESVLTVSVSTLGTETLKRADCGDTQLKQCENSRLRALDELVVRRPVTR